MARKQKHQTRPKRERRPEDRHASAKLADLLNDDTRKKLEALKDQLGGTR